MKFFDDVVTQKNKYIYNVCGDFYLCERTDEKTALVLCDGIGSGIYANIAAITCANRMMELLRCGMSIRAACETVAESMHRARKENIPFSAFSAIEILPDGQFVAYNYEAPEIIHIQNGTASVLKPRFYTAGYEVVGEVTGVLSAGDAVILSSDGVTQAGLGYGHKFGIGSDGIANFINKTLSSSDDIDSEITLLSDKIVDMCASISKGRHEDDTTLALIHCRESKQLTVLTGPPSKPSMDKDYVNEFMSAEGKKIICGSTTTDIVSRVLGKKASIAKLSAAYGAPPEYHIDGVDLTTEGAIMLNQVFNILGEPEELFVEDSAAERFCKMLTQADVINLMIGNAKNDAHEALLFKQAGVRVRKTTVNLIAEKLRDMGKLVVENYY